jgi:GNAT superfamily N-acetyltransferase
LTSVGIEEQELNEVSWWSHWGDVSWLGEGAYVITSTSFPEPLFNHATIMNDVSDVDSIFEHALQRFREAGVRPSFFVIDDPRFLGLRSRLESAGYVALDTMEVMAAGAEEPRESGSVEVMRVVSDVHEWVSTYLRSFYGDGGPEAEVEAAAKRAAKDKDVSLVLARQGKEVVGQMALLRRGGLLGAYCVGTVPEHRRSGVASGMLSHASGQANEQGLTLVLQTFAEDHVEGFYLKRGFRRLYGKSVLSTDAGSR